MDDPEQRRLTVVPPAKPEEALTLDCSFRGVEGSRVYPVAASEWERVQSVLDSERKTFLGLDTLDGRSAFLNLDHLQLCRLVIGPFRPVRPTLDALTCQLLGPDPAYELPDVDREWAPNIAMSLEEFGNLGERFLQFPDEFGGMWAFNMADIVFLEFPALWQDEAMEAWEEMEAEIEAREKARAKRGSGTRRGRKKKGEPSEG